MEANDFATIRLLTRKVLENAGAFEWELKGLGLIRTYLSDDLKIHVWDSRFKVPNVSMMHEHPWSFESTIVAGRLEQFRFDRHSVACTCGCEPYNYSLVTCGPGGCLQTNAELTRLRRGPLEVYGPGSKYIQETDEVHHSLPVDGTVTLVRRLFYKPERAAHVYWPDGEEWVSSEPRRAKPYEAIDAAQGAIKQWF